MIDDIFGDTTTFTLVNDDNEIINTIENNTLIDDSTTDKDSSNKVDELFGDLSTFILENDDDENIESSEIIDYSDPIDPVATGIEVTDYEPIGLEDEENTINFSVKDLTPEEQLVFDHIKSFNNQCKEECDNPMDIAELAMIQNVENPLFFSISKDYLFRTPWDLSFTRFKNQYEADRKGIEPKELIAMPVVFDTEYQTFLEEFKKYFFGRKKLNITVQIGGIHQNAPKKVYSHWDIRKTKLPEYFPVLEKQDTCVYQRYLADNGYHLDFQLKDSGSGEWEYMNCKNILQIPVFGHMLQADFMAMWQPGTKMYRYMERIISGRDKNNNLNGKKRLVGESDVPELLKPRIIAYDHENNVSYALQFPIHDSQSLHGIGKSLAKLAQVTKTEIEDDKNIYSKEQKKRMLNEYLKCNEKEHRDNWVKYSVGADLKVYEVFINNAKQFYNLYSDPEINAVKYFTLPRPTIGRSVADIIAARILKNFESDVLKDIEKLIRRLLSETKSYKESKKTFIQHLKKLCKPNNDYEKELLQAGCKHISYRIENECLVIEYKEPDKLPKNLQRWIIDTFCEASSAMNLAGLSDTRRINAKIQGGRCFRNKPLTTTIEGIIADPDFDGAYSSFMRCLMLPMCANPFRIEYDLKKKCQTMSLAQIRKKYGKELIPGMYQFFGSYTNDKKNLIDPEPKPLIYAQDLIPSYHPHNSIKQVTVGSEWLEKSDTSYIYTNQITNGIFTHWNLQIIDHILSKESKKEILNSKVTSGIIYRKSDRLNTVRELLDNYQNYQGCDTYKIRDNKEIITRDRYRGWFGFNLGELVVTPVRKMRSQYKKKTPENEFYKLIGNTVYGVLCSKYFPVSNVVTANNITSGVRSGMWCMEKGLDLQGSITDGGLGNMLKVAFGNKPNKLTDKNTCQTHRNDKRTQTKHVKYGIIGGYKNIEWKQNSDDTVIVTNQDDTTFELWECQDKTNPRFKEMSKHFDDLIFEHLAEQFPKLDIFHADFTDDNGNPRKGILRIECKGLTKKAVTHGASNYLIRGGFHAMYDKDLIEKIGNDARVFCAMRSYRKGYGTHPQIFMENLGENPDMVDRSEVFDQSILLKVGLFQERYYSYFENSDYQVGDTFFMERLIREFPLSAFTFKNAEQRKNWVNEVSVMRGKYGQSIESFFVNDNGQIEFEKMIQAFDMWIDADYYCLADVYGDNKTATRKAKMLQSHPEYEKLQQRKNEKRKGKK